MTDGTFTSHTPSAMSDLDLLVDSRRIAKFDKRTAEALVELAELRPLVAYGARLEFWAVENGHLCSVCMRELPAATVAVPTLCGDCEAEVKAKEARG